jgi:osmotically-inducible protein OsmY
MRLRTTVVAGAIGAAVAFFFDPQNGKRRRKMTVDRIAAFFRRRARESARLARGVEAEAHGVSQKVQHRKEEPKPQPDDTTLARTVETEIFRDADVPKGQINVNVQRGIVQLRGEVPQPEMIHDLGERARHIAGVLEVENLLHLPGTPAPMHE